MVEVKTERVFDSRLDTDFYKTTIKNLETGKKFVGYDDQYNFVDVYTACKNIGIDDDDFPKVEKYLEEKKMLYCH